jgi:hypothetical protein
VSVLFMAAIAWLTTRFLPLPLQSATSYDRCVLLLELEVSY